MLYGGSMNPAAVFARVFDRVLQGWARWSHFVRRPRTRQAAVLATAPKELLENNETGGHEVRRFSWTARKRLLISCPSCREDSARAVRRARQTRGHEVSRFL